MIAGFAAGDRTPTAALPVLDTLDVPHVLDAAAPERPDPHVADAVVAPALPPALAAATEPAAWAQPRWTPAKRTRDP